MISYFKYRYRRRVTNKICPLNILLEDIFWYCLGSLKSIVTVVKNIIFLFHCNASSCVVTDLKYILLLSKGNVIGHWIIIDLLCWRLQGGLNFSLRLVSWLELFSINLFWDQISHVLICQLRQAPLSDCYSMKFFFVPLWLVNTSRDSSADSCISMTTPVSSVELSDLDRGYCLNWSSIDIGNFADQSPLRQMTS